MLTLLDFAWITVALGFTYIVGRQVIVAVIICVAIYIVIKAFLPNHASSRLFRTIRPASTDGFAPLHGNQPTYPVINAIEN